MCTRFAMREVLHKLLAASQCVRNISQLSNSFTNSTSPLLRSSSLFDTSSQSYLLWSRTFHSSCGLLRKLDTHAYPPLKQPTNKRGRWEPIKTLKDIREEIGYTTEDIPLPKSGGRGPNGRTWNWRRGGGFKKVYKMVDFVRGGPEDGQGQSEKVEKIVTDRYNRSADLALVAGGERKRWILATHNLKEGDLIQSSRRLTQMPVRASDGDSYPVGSLPIGTLVSCLERFPGDGARVARAAGTMAQLIRKTGDMCVLRMPSKREICVSAKCQATVGRVSNIEHDKHKLGKAGAARWMGIRPRSGRYHRKTGRFGRKIRPPRPMKTYTNIVPPKGETYRIDI